MLKGIDEILLEQHRGHLANALEAFKSFERRYKTYNNTEEVSEHEIDELLKCDNILLGADVQDTVTGFVGVLTAHTTYLEGEDMALIENANSEKWVAYDRLEEI